MKCPFCRSNRPVISGDRNYYCPDCKKLFDDSPEEGGDYSDRNASARIEREERERERKLTRIHQGRKY